MVHGMRRADLWGAVACHSGDMAFDLVYRPVLPRALDVLARIAPGSHGSLLRRFEQRSMR